MDIITKTKTLLAEYKRQITLLLLAAGCFVTGYSLLRPNVPLIDSAVFKELMDSNYVKEVTVIGNQLNFRTMLPGWFAVDVGSIGFEYLQGVAAKIGMEIKDLPFCQAHWKALWRISGAVCGLIATAVLQTPTVHPPQSSNVPETLTETDTKMDSPSPSTESSQGEPQQFQDLEPSSWYKIWSSPVKRMLFPNVSGKSLFNNMNTRANFKVDTPSSPQIFFLEQEMQ